MEERREVGFYEVRRDGFGYTYAWWSGHFWRYWSIDDTIESAPAGIWDWVGAKEPDTPPKPKSRWWYLVHPHPAFFEIRNW